MKANTLMSPVPVTTSQAIHQAIKAIQPQKKALMLLMKVDTLMSPVPASTSQAIRQAI